MDKIFSILILCFLILTTLFLADKGYFERLTGSPDSSDASNGDATKPYIMLYEGFNFQNLAYSYSPGQIDYDDTSTIRGYLRQIIKCNLKSVDINLPKIGNEYDEVRRVELWGVDERDNNIASVESDFYNSYLEPELELRSNPARYRQLIRALPGDHVRVDIADPVKKVFVIAIM
jgi:hypothetical protein